MEKLYSYILSQINCILEKCMFQFYRHGFEMNWWALELPVMLKAGKIMSMTYYVAILTLNNVMNVSQIVFDFNHRTNVN